MLIVVWILCVLLIVIALFWAAAFLFTRGSIALPSVTEGLDGLRDRLNEYFELGARFTKWRGVIPIGPDIPTACCIEVNAHALARFAALSQQDGRETYTIEDALAKLGTALAPFPGAKSVVLIGYGFGEFTIVDLSASPPRP